MIPPPLLRDILAGNCLPFIGAGFSLNAELPVGMNMPDSKALTEDLAKELEDKKTDDPLQVAQDYEDTYDRTQLIESIERNLHLEHAKPGEVHKYFVKIPTFDVIYTTNFDLLLENAYQQENKRPIRIIAGPKQLPLYSGPPTVNIIKMHGDVHRQDNLVITKNDYKNYMNNYRPIVIHLSSLLLTKTPLFLGYRLSDPNLKQIKEIIDEMLGKYVRRGYIVLFNASEKEKDEYRKMNLYPINLQSDTKSKNELLLDFLKEICQYVSSQYINVIRVSNQKVDEISTSLTSVQQDVVKPETKSDHISFMMNSILIMEDWLYLSLQKKGLSSNDLKKPLGWLLYQATQMGLLSTQEISFVGTIMDIRNGIIHSNRIPSDDEIKWITDTAYSIKEKLSKAVMGYAPVGNLIVNTDKSSYSTGDTITISGSITSVIKGTPLTIQILDPDKEIVNLVQIESHYDHKYSYSVNAVGTLWKKNGKYTVRVQYGFPNVVEETSFEFKNTIPTSTKIFTVNGGGNKNFDIEYSISGGTVKDLILDSEGKSLLLSIDATTDGDIKLTIPRELIDAKTSTGEDDLFFVLADGAEIEYDEVSSSDSRTLMIQFLMGDSEIEIIGTHLRPLDRVSVTNPIIVDQNGHTLDEINVGQETKIGATLTNNQNESQKYAFIVQIQDEEITLDTLFMSGILAARESLHTFVSWKPTQIGRFSVQIFVWQNLDNPDALSPPIQLTIKVRSNGKTMPTELPQYDLKALESKLDTIIETYSGFATTKTQLNDGIKLYDSCWNAVKGKFPSKSELDLLKVKPVSFLRLLAVPNPSSELKAVREELIIKAKRLRKIISEENEN